jgi:membrane-associated phospholipid phosphatase
MELLSLRESKLNYSIQKNKILKSFINISIISTKLFNVIPFIFIIIFLYFIKILNIESIVKIMLSFVLLYTFKNIVKRPRPFNLNTEVKNLDDELFDLYSFPSGHTFYASILAFYIYRKIKYFFVFLLPLFVGFSRIHLGVHYVTDILTSIILAYIVYI